MMRVSGRVFELSSPLFTIRLVVSPSGVRPASAPGRLYEKALRVLREALIDYGELRVRDAVDVLSHELGVGRRDARRVLAVLVDKGYIRVESGYIIIRY